MNKTARKLYAIRYREVASSAYTLYASKGFSSLAAVAVMGLLMALFLGLVGTGVVKLPGNNGIPISPIPLSDPVEDDQACNDEFNADCEKFLKNDPEDLTPAQIQKALEEN